jgi:hypothetical protein
MNVFSPDPSCVAARTAGLASHNPYFLFGCRSAATRHLWLLCRQLNERCASSPGHARPSGLVQYRELALGIMIPQPRLLVIISSIVLSFRNFRKDKPRRLLTMTSQILVFHLTGPSSLYDCTKKMVLSTKTHRASCTRAPGCSAKARRHAALNPSFLKAIS